MIRGLLAKELRQNALAFTFILVAPIAGFLLLNGHGRLRDAAGSGFDQVRMLLTLFAPLACLVLGQLLVATEFRHKTQLFLEGLPLPRSRMLLVKFALGVLVTFGSGALVLGWAWWNARGAEAMTPRFATLLAVKMAGWMGFIFTLFFAHAFLGRYRVFFGLLVIFSLITCSTLDVPLSEWGPFALVDERFAFERQVWPVEALAVTGGLIALLTAVGFVLGLARDATVATLLAEKMSSREKLFFTLLVFALLITLGETAERRERATPVLMPGANESQFGAVRVLASAAVDAPTSAEAETLTRLVNDVGAEFDALVAYLGCRTFPPIFIVHRRDLKGGALVDGELKQGQGVLVRVNVVAPEFSRDALVGWLVRATLKAHTSGRAEREKNLWALDAIEWWWPRSERGTATAWTAETRRLGALKLPPHFSSRDLERWLTVRQKIRTSQARELAGSGLAWMAEKHGLEKQRAFLSARFGRAEPVDVRAWFRDVWNPTSARLRKALGVREEEFVDGWRAALEEKP